MILKKYFYRKEELKMTNNNIESVDKNNVKMLKLYISRGECTMYNPIYKKQAPICELKGRPRLTILSSLVMSRHAIAYFSYN